MLFCSFFNSGTDVRTDDVGINSPYALGWAVGLPAARAVSEKRATQCCRPVGKAMINDLVNEEGGG
jgi:hypothetical protein